MQASGESLWTSSRVLKLSTLWSLADAAFLPDAQVVATLGAAAAAMVAEKAETSEGEEHSFNADCDGSGRLLTPLLHDVKEAMELEGTVPEKHRLQHCGQDLTSTSVTGRAPRGSPLQVQVRRVTRFLGQTWATGMCMSASRGKRSGGSNPWWPTNSLDVPRTPEQLEGSREMHSFPLP